MRQKLGLYVKLVALCIHTCCSSHQAATLPDIKLQRGSLEGLKYLNPDAHLDLLTYLSIVKAPPCPPPHPGHSSLTGLTGPGPATPMISWPLRRGFHRSARRNQRHLAPNPNLPTDSRHGELFYEICKNTQKLCTKNIWHIAPLVLELLWKFLTTHGLDLKERWHEIQVKCSDSKYLQVAIVTMWTLQLLMAWNCKLKMKSCEQEVCRYQQTDLWIPLYLDGHPM